MIPVAFKTLSRWRSSHVAFKTLSRWRSSPWLLLFLRVALGLTFLYAGVSKLRQPWYVFAGMIDNYGLIPPSVSEPIARTLPAVEAVLGVTLVVGLYRKLASTIAVGTLAFFFVLMLQAYLRGLKIDCGCLGAGQTLGPKTLLRDGVLLSASLVLSYLYWKGSKQTEV